MIPRRTRFNSLHLRPLGRRLQVFWQDWGNRVEQKSRLHVVQGGPEIRTTPPGGRWVPYIDTPSAARNTFFNLHITA